MTACVKIVSMPERFDPEVAVVIAESFGTSWPIQGVLALQDQLSLALGLFEDVVDCETRFLRHVLHFVIFRQDGRGDAFEALIAAHFNKHFQELRAQSMFLPLVADSEGELRFV